jgi:hypothetical protein
MKTFLTLSLFFVFVHNIATETSKEEYIAKYIISLVRYIEWPASMHEGNFKIGVYGSFNMYKAITEETVNIGLQNRNTDIMNLAKIEDISLAPFHIIIISSEKCSEENLKKVKDLIGSNATLLITEKEKATKSGAGINFVLRNNKLAYELNKTNATKNGLKIGRQVETFAVKVEE